MKIKKITIENFRGYAKEIVIYPDQLNVFIGKNDVGKSTILEALDIFFNNIKVDNEDRNKNRPEDNISIAVSFSDHPPEIIIDSNNKTTLENEHLLNSKGLLEIKKEYSGKTLKMTPLIVAEHPTCKLGKELLLKKNTELKSIVKDNDWECADKTKNAELRKSIWESCGELELKEINIPADKEDAKNFWVEIEKYLPTYALFRADRENKESDSEVQDPMKATVKELMKEQRIIERLEEIAETVREEVTKIANNTLTKLSEMNPDIAKTLNPFIPATQNLKWAEVFKGIGIYSDENIPLDKRGSGVKRLVLLNFFRAEAERSQAAQGKNNLIYAMEEPETSQHPGHQEMLIKAFKEMSENRQILLTTHSPIVVRLLPKESYNLITKENGNITMASGTSLLSQDALALKHCSGNEINFLAFGYVSPEFHNELYGFIESKRPEIYKEKINNGVTREYFNAKTGNTEKITIHKYIRNQIHHPENTGKNSEYTQEELRQSIKDMREFLFAANPDNPSTSESTQIPKTT